MTQPCYSSSMNSLNPAQREAVETIKGPVLILAGAGAGKTRVIVERIGNLIRMGVAPTSILAITFTNKAASEMRERIRGLLTDTTEISALASGETPFVSTFHSLAAHIIREHARLLDLPRHFAIFDRADSRQAIRQAVKAAGLDPKQFDPARILGVISKEKGNGISLEEFQARESGEYIGREIGRIWEEYERILSRERALDFDDLLTAAEGLLRRKEVLAKYQRQWRYIHIDEYQDTNHIQYLLVRKLAASDQNICVVGDIDQNIYSWRGARLRNILDFEKDYSEARIIVLEENYRSTKTILDAANAIIAKNIYRKEKRLFTKNPVGEAISLYEAPDEGSEAEFVAATAGRLREQGVRLEEIAVLFRANFQSRALEEAFLSYDIPYQIVGTRFFERKEVKDLLSYLRAALNPGSLSDLKRIINVPTRGIGKISLLKIFEGKEGELSGKARDGWGNLKKFLEEIRGRMGGEPVSLTLRFILETSGLREELERGGEEDTERLENLKELVTFASRYDNLASGEGVVRLLTEAALASEQDDLERPKKGVKLMTVHAAKGLEFDYVFITGLEEGLFPHERDTAITAEEAEEERRLFYVALTRARKKIFLSYTQIRTLYGTRQINIPSEFITDIPERWIIEEEGNYGLLRKPLRVIKF
ncbi:ATP-dependent DNA helicase PcrA [Patescibacteria group bacterium]|nr:MAG: ATP-dependent DNA helicase PcrA [Patescibacteria group bacterium]